MVTQADRIRLCSLTQWHWRGVYRSANKADFFCILLTSASPQGPAHGTGPFQVGTHLGTDRVCGGLGRGLTSRGGEALQSNRALAFHTATPTFCGEYCPEIDDRIIFIKKNARRHILSENHIDWYYFDPP
jgi:hypothetical protein